MRFRTRWSVLATALVPVLVLVAGCADSYQVAASTGDLEVSHSDLADEVDQWMGNDALLAALQSPNAATDGDGEAPQSVVNEVLNLRIQAELARQALDDAGVDYESDPQFAATRDQIGAGQGSELFASFGEELRARVLDDVALLQYTSAAGVFPSEIDVYVSPRYGTVDENGVVEAPEGAAGDLLDQLGA